MAKPRAGQHTARLTPLQRAFIEVMRRRDPARRWAPKPSRKRRKAPWRGRHSLRRPPSHAGVRQW